MAEFCAGCALDGVSGGDFAGWLAGVPGYEWWLCEGCGWHRFDDAGQPACAPGGASTPTVRDQACPRCLRARVAELVASPEFDSDTGPVGGEPR